MHGARFSIHETHRALVFFRMRNERAVIILASFANAVARMMARHARSIRRRTPIDRAILALRSFASHGCAMRIERPSIRDGQAFWLIRQASGRPDFGDPSSGCAADPILRASSQRRAPRRHRGCSAERRSPSVRAINAERFRCILSGSGMARPGADVQCHSRASLRQASTTDDAPPDDRPP